MADVFVDFVREFEQLLQAGSSLSLAASPAPELMSLTVDAPVCLVFSPHPDDEAISGALPWRLRSEAGWRVVNVAVTLGSNPLRRAARWSELTDSCAWLGFELVSASGETEHGLQQIGPRSAAEQPADWARSVDRVAALLQQLRPRVVVCPHALDGHPVHIGTHHLVRDALRLLDSAQGPHLLLSEYWNTQMQPALMLELGARHVADLMAALLRHTGEVTRNPYHLRLPAFFMDGVRRGSERVCGAGASAPDFSFAALYGWQRWRAGAWQDHPAQVAPLHSPLSGLFD